MTIRSKPHIGGHEHESEWPPREPSGAKGRFYRNPKTGEFDATEPDPEAQPKRYGRAPLVMFDSMEPVYHEAAQRMISSRKEWELTDKMTGSITFSSKEQARPPKSESVLKRELKADRRKAGLEALQRYRANPREVKQKIQKQAEQQMQTLKKSGLEPHLKKEGITIND